MKQHVIVVPSDRLIIVDGTPLQFDFPAPEKLHAIQWHNGTGEMEWRDDINHPLTPADYAEDVAPFVELWEAEKARLEEEAAAAEAARLAEYNSVEATRGRKEEELANAFTKATATAHLTCSLGFDIDANDAANRNVSGLVTLMEAEGAPENLQFCDYNNEIHTVTLTDLHVMQQEIIANGSALYARKWALRDAINIAATTEELNAITISF
ncbi:MULTISPECIES: DUF4376 domain-containing protein [Bilophila]|uniref:DUF4376 domain-containing protein n=1 Tax=Bilophila TaxID=35832 RepID=UPI0002238109|nr:MULTISPECIES: DUF4376 domain-containing protein [Bilophila]EGW42611.1 hypothetical protein HMPREF0178_00027 [Bilophila sp. 4_1_30]MBS5374895.1 DUF4376 domain-containing protein [Bilophila wadsworthia]MCG4631909.1 DUF4376 domain-containing protein [Bilophila wadsworthia]